MLKKIFRKIAGVLLLLSTLFMTYKLAGADIEVSKNLLAGSTLGAIIILIAGSIYLIKD